MSKNSNRSSTVGLKSYYEVFFNGPFKKYPLDHKIRKYQEQYVHKLYTKRVLQALMTGDEDEVRSLKYRYPTEKL